MIKLASRENCTGCAACRAVCPCGAIQMERDQEGFLYPQIAQKCCIQCGACMATCPAIAEELPVQEPAAVYAAIFEDESIRGASSSGGAFSALAQSILSEGGVVYGVVLDEENRVRHKRIDNPQNLTAMRGSKYVQSEIEDCLTLLEQDLRAGRKVLFTGTPCQTAGAYQFVKTRRIAADGLLLCDVVCHGTPSPEVWKDYVSLLERENGGPVSSITFRGKEEGWHAPIAIRFQDARGGLHTDRRFTQIFLDNLVLRPACHNCEYTTPNRVSDLTIADFWGIEQTENASLDDNKGVSLILVRTPKGAQRLERCTGLRQWPARLQDAVAQQTTLKEPYPCPPEREQFWNEYLGRGFAQTLTRYTAQRPQEICEQVPPYDEDAVLAIISDGPGSKGDEAMLRGFLNLMKGRRIFLLSPRAERWAQTVPDRALEFSEYFLPVEKFELAADRAGTLVIIGADVIDGTCGLDDSLTRLTAIKKAAEANRRVCVFCSFRSDVHPEILEMLQTVPETVEFYLRDEQSVENFFAQTQRKGRYFPDFGFFCEKRQTQLTCQVKEEIAEWKRQGCAVIGVNFGEPSFRSFYDQHTMEMRGHYVTTVLRTIRQVFPTAMICPISHDTRHWEGYFSDEDYQNLAMKIAQNEGWGDRVKAIPPCVSHAELREILPELTAVVTGRMHLSVATMASAVPPVVYTGAPKDGKFSMIDKVRGMLSTRIGREDLVAVTIAQLREALSVVAQEMEPLCASLRHSEEQQEEKDRQSATWFRAQFGLGELPEQEKEDPLFLQEALMHSAREAYLNEERLRAQETIRRRQWDIELANKQGHIEQLIQSERELKAEVEQAYQLETQVFQQTNRINELESWVAILQTRSNMLDQVYASRTWRYTHRITSLVRRIFPPQTLRGRALISGLRAPIRFEHWLRSLPGKRREKRKRKQAFRNLAPIEFPVFETPQVSIIIPVYNQFFYTAQCLQSILNTCADLSYEVILADDNSTDDTRRITEKVKNITVVRNRENLRFLRNCNHAAEYARGEYLVFLNNDTIVHENWLQSLLTLMEQRKDCGMAGSKILFADGKLQEAGGIIWKGADGWNYGRGDDPEKSEYNYVKEVDYISGCSIMIRKALWEEIGGFDERYAPAYCEDSDLAFEVRAHGYKVLYQPLSVVDHFEGVSNGTDLSEGQKKYQLVNQKKLLEKWRDELDQHHFNPGEKLFLARDRSEGHPCVLFIDHYTPTFDQDAGSRTVYDYLRLFVRMGYNVKFLPDNFYRMPKYCEALQQMGVEVMYGPEYAQYWQNWIRENRNYIDFVFTNRPHISVKYMDFLRENTHAKIIYYGHDLHSLRMYREYQLTGDESLLESSRKWKAIEYGLMRKADVVYYLSEIEREIILKEDPSILVKLIIPFVFDKVDPVDYDPEKRKDILFLGGFGHTPNVDAVLWFAEQVFPLVLEKLPQLRWHILGSHPPEEVQALASDNILVHGFVTDEQLAEFYANCRMTVVPLRYGAGIKGKVIEAMKFGSPVLTTSVGAEGILDVQQAFAVEDGAAQFAARLVELYQNGEQLRKMSAAACDYVRTHYSSETAMKQIREDF